MTVYESIQDFFCIVREVLTYDKKPRYKLTLSADGKRWMCYRTYWNCKEYKSMEFIGYTEKL